MKTICKKWKLSFVLITLFTLVLNSFTAFADINHLMINTGSNALMTLELNDDYAVMPMSSVGTVNNTVTSNSVVVQLRYVDGSGNGNWIKSVAFRENNRFVLSRVDAPSGYYFTEMQILLYSVDLPSTGSYKLSFDYSSNVSYSISQFVFASLKQPLNAADQLSWNVVDVASDSGDVFLAPLGINLTNVSYLNLQMSIPQSQYVSTVGGSFAISFVSTAHSDSYITTAGTNTSNSDYQAGVSDSLSDLSSSVDSMTEDLSSAAQNLEYISTSQNLIIQGIDNVIMHISDQLYAFWDQLFNLIHLPTLAKMDDIISAIQNMDLEIEVNLDGLKSTINNMSTAVQNKLQSTTDQITGGYDNSEITQENEKLEQSINQYDEVESGIFEDAEGFIGDFEYPSVDNLPLGIIKALSFVGSFLQGVFLSMGEFSVIITFSLTMIFVMVVVGYYRIRS